MTFETYSVEHRATVYRIHVFVVPRRGSDFDMTYILAESGWDTGHGEWIRLDVNSIAVSYLAEKMPETWQRQGDHGGWKRVFAKAGIEVFGTEEDE